MSGKHWSVHAPTSTRLEFELLPYFKPPPPSIVSTSPSSTDTITPSSFAPAAMKNGSVKQKNNEQAARWKAQNMKVFVSGIQGQQPLEVGIAYYYRGHFVYGTAGNPIEPILYSTRKGINIIGIRDDLAPRYDPIAPSLVPESSIAALKKSCYHVWSAQKKEEEKEKKKVAGGTGDIEVVEEESGTDSEDDCRMAGLHLPTIVRHAPEVSKRLLRVSSDLEVAGLGRPTSAAESRLSVAGLGQKYDGLYGLTSWGSSPSLRHGPYATRNISNTSLPSLSAQGHSNLHPGGRASSFTPHDRSRFLADSAPGSQLVSAINTPYNSRPSSPALVRPAASTSRLGSLLAVSEADKALRHRPKPIGTGRPRRASMALNKHHNAANPPARRQACAIHGDSCDGVSVERTWLSNRAIGFKEIVPMVMGEGGRVMVDWHQLLVEAQTRRS